MNRSRCFWCDYGWFCFCLCTLLFSANNLHCASRTSRDSRRGLGNRKECPQTICTLLGIWKDTEFLSSHIKQLMKQRHRCWARRQAPPQAPPTKASRSLLLWTFAALSRCCLRTSPELPPMHLAFEASTSCYWTFPVCLSCFPWLDWGLLGWQGLSLPVIPVPSPISSLQSFSILNTSSLRK